MADSNEQQKKQPTPKRPTSTFDTVLRIARILKPLQVNQQKAVLDSLQKLLEADSNG